MKKYSVICPQCGEPRKVAQHTYLNYRKGKLVPRCYWCAHGFGQCADEASTNVSPGQNRERLKLVLPVAVPGKRECLRCEEIFISPDRVKIRICQSCKGRHDYRDLPAIFDGV